MKWLSIGSLMCLVAGGFHISYGMMKDSDEEPQTTISVDVPDLIDLPDEIFGEVMSFLSPNDILHFGQTSKRHPKPQMRYPRPPKMRHPRT